MKAPKPETVSGLSFGTAPDTGQEDAGPPDTGPADTGPRGGGRKMRGRKMRGREMQGAGSAAWRGLCVAPQAARLGATGLSTPDGRCLANLPEVPCLR